MYSSKSRLSPEARVVFGVSGAQFVMAFSEHMYEKGMLL